MLVLEFNLKSIELVFSYILLLKKEKKNFYARLKAVVIRTIKALLPT